MKLSVGAKVRMVLTERKSGTLRKINSVVIPIVYSEKFYKDVLDPTLDDLNKLSEPSPISHSVLQRDGERFLHNALATTKG